MADDPTKDQDQGGTGTEPDYKALYEEAKAEADKWKANSRKNEGRAKSNADAAKSLEEATKQLSELSERLAAIEGENEALKEKEARSALVSEVAEKTGVPKAIVASLAATDKKALTEAATAIAEAFGTPGAPTAFEAGKIPRTDVPANDNAKQFGEIIDEMLG